MTLKIPRIVHYFLSCRSPEEGSLTTVLKNHIALNIDLPEECEDYQRIPIRRKTIWKNTLRCLSKPSFIQNRGLNIVFVDEGAVDCGGPMRYN